MPSFQTVDNPAAITKAGLGQYIWAIIAVTFIGVLLIIAILFLRPEFDPLVVITTVSGLGATFSASLLALIKAQETHLSVNSRLTEFIRTQSKASHNEGVIEGTKGEQNRVAVQKATQVAAQIEQIKVENPKNVAP